MEFLEVIQENWFEIVSAVGTIIGVFFATKRKRTPAERQALKIKKAEAKLKKDVAKAQEDAHKLEELKKEVKTQ